MKNLWKTNWAAGAFLICAMALRAAGWLNEFDAPGVNGKINAVAVKGDRVYIGGTFTDAWGVPVNNVACRENGIWHDMEGGLTGAFFEEGDMFDENPYLEVMDLAFSGSHLYAVGWFRSPKRCLAGWDGTAWTAGGAPVHSFDNVPTVDRLAFAHGMTYLAGDFFSQTPESGMFSSLIRIDASGTPFPLGAGLEAGRRVNAFVPVGDVLYIGGGLTVSGHPDIQNIGRWDGTAWHALDAGVNGPVSAMTLHQGDLIVSGGFSEAGGVPVDGLARWDGSAWHAVTAGFDGAVTCLASDGNVFIAAGAFTHINGLQVDHAAVWDGSEWNALEGGGLNGRVKDLVIENGTAWFCGDFTRAGTGEAHGLAAYVLPRPPVPAFAHFQAVTELLPHLSRASMGVAWGDMGLFVANDNDETDDCIAWTHGAFAALDLPSLTRDAGKSVSGAWADYDNDGLQDIFVTRMGTLGALYRRTDDGFEAAPFPESAGNGFSAAWADYDLDGHLDLFVANRSGPNRLFRNQGDGSFSAVEEGPVVSDSGATLGAWCDVNLNGFPDLFVANSGGTNNAFYRNNGDGTFTKVTEGDFVNDGGDSWSASFMDYDNDGDFDLYVANNSGVNFLYANDGSGLFTRVHGLEPTLPEDFSRSSAWGDVNNDGRPDLFVSNRRNEDRLYINRGGNFDRYTLSSGYNHRGCAFGDYDGDGRLDLFVCNDGEPNQLFQNTSENGNHWLQVACVGIHANKSAIGAKVRAKANINGRGLWQIREISSQTGWGGQNQMIAHFGLADAETVDSLQILWPGGSVWDSTGVAANQYLIVTEPDTFSTLPQNHPPTALPDSAWTRQDSSIRIAVLSNDSDADGDTLVITGLDTSVTLGTVCVEPGDTTVFYTPPPGVFGEDRFSYTISDGRGGLDTADVHITIREIHINTPPVAEADSAVTDQNVMIRIAVLSNDSDADGDTLVITGLDTSATLGTVEMLPGDTLLTYVPPLDFTGTDGFEYVVSDGNGGCDTAEVFIKVWKTSSIESGAGVPENFALEQNHPNPFNPSTAIVYQLPLHDRVRLEVFDVTGQLVALIADGHQKAGSHTAHFDASHLPSGVYFYRLQAGAFIRVRKMTLMR